MVLFLWSFYGSLWQLMLHSLGFHKMHKVATFIKPGIFTTDKCYRENGCIAHSVLKHAGHCISQNITDDLSCFIRSQTFTLQDENQTSWQSFLWPYIKKYLDWFCTGMNASIHIYFFYFGNLVKLFTFAPSSHARSDLWRWLGANQPGVGLASVVPFYLRHWTVSPACFSFNSKCVCQTVFREGNIACSNAVYIYIYTYTRFIKYIRMQTLMHAKSRVLLIGLTVKCFCAAFPWEHLKPFQDWSY